MKRVTWVCEPDKDGAGVWGWTRHKTLKEANRKASYWRSRGINPLILREERNPTLHEQRG